MNYVLDKKINKIQKINLLANTYISKPLDSVSPLEVFGHFQDFVINNINIGKLLFKINHVKMDVNNIIRPKRKINAVYICVTVNDALYQNKTKSKF